MRRTAVTLSACLLALLALASAARAQDSHTSETDDYTLELPTQVWKALPRSDTAAHQHTEYINGERSDGYLRVRRGMLSGETSLTEFARTEADTKLRFLPGFVSGKESPFSGRLSGVVSTYEYTNAGKPMAGRVYYLKADERTVFVLHFTGARERLQRIQNQTDAIARSFKPKQ